MMTLHLGVADIPYNISPGTGRRRKKATAATKTTGQVAEILEDEYHILQHFAELHKEDIGKLLENSIAGALETAMMGGPATLSFADAESGIEALMKDMLTNKELDRLGYPGIPTAAALKGVSHRFAHPYARRPARPSFVDTGLMQASYKAWMETS